MARSPKEAFPVPEGSQPLNFKVPAGFKREFKVYAAQQGVSMTELLIEGFRVLKAHPKITK